MSSRHRPFGRPIQANLTTITDARGATPTCHRHTSEKASHDTSGYGHGNQITKEKRIEHDLTAL